MKPIDFDGLYEANLERIAARHNLSFHLSNGFAHKIPGYVPQSFTVISHCCEDEQREATDEEVEMWRALCPEDPDTLETLPEEIKYSWQYRRGPFTISADDYWVIVRKLGREYLDPCTMRDGLLAGFYGTYQERAPIYVSRAIPVGLFYEGERIPELHWRPHHENKNREVEPELPFEVVCKLHVELRPFKLRG
jgi:hypothetical protein